MDRVRKVALRNSAWSLLAALLLVSCATSRRPAAAPEARVPGERSALILAINDTYRVEGLYHGEVGGLARVRSLRAALEEAYPDLLVLHAGDFLFPSFLSRLYRGEQMVDVLNHLDGDGRAFDSRFFVTLGNHELEKPRWKDAPLLASRVHDSQFTWLAANLVFPSGPAGEEPIAAPNLAARALVESGGIRVGIFGLVTDLKRADYVVFDSDYAAVARRETAALRAAGAEVVVGLTHLPVGDDLALLSALGEEGPDVIVGGHEHTALARDAGGRWVFKADSDAASASLIRLRVSGGEVSVKREALAELARSSPPADAAVAALAAGWVARHAQEFCAGRAQPPGCLDQVVGQTRTRLVAEEVSIRSAETALGDWIADRMRAAFAERGAQVAFLNSGSLRLNRDIPAGSPFVVRDVEELCEYPAALRLLQIDGATLQQVADHATMGWPGNGSWLQVSGFAFRHDPQHPGHATGLTLLAPEGPRPVVPTERILAVTIDYLVDPTGDQDGYTMVRPEQVIGEGGDVKTLVLQGLQAAGEAGIGPVLEGRVCLAAATGPCLAIPSSP